MNIHVTRDGQDFGPYKVEDINGYLKLGSLLPTDMAWHEGLPSWIPLFQIPGVQVPAKTQVRAPQSIRQANPAISNRPRLVTDAQTPRNPTAKHNSSAPTTQSPRIGRATYTGLVLAVVLLVALCLAFAFWPGLREQVQGINNSHVGAKSSSQTEADSKNIKNRKPESKWHFDVPRGEAKNINNILEVETDLTSFFGKPLVIRGKLQVSSFYIEGYENAERTHFSFEIRDENKGRAFLYMPRTEAADLRKQLLDSGSALDGVFLVVIKRRSITATPVCLFELMDYNLQKY